MAEKKATKTTKTAKKPTKKPTVSHYVKRGRGLVCDACGGKVSGHAEAAVFPEIPWWMKKCPVCGLRITKAEEANQESTELDELQDIALGMLVMIGRTEQSNDIALRMVKCGVPEQHVINALSIARKDMDDGQKPQD